jgi:hypothetical protein
VSTGSVSNAGTMGTAARAAHAAAVAAPLLRATATTRANAPGAKSASPITAGLVSSTANASAGHVAIKAVASKHARATTTAPMARGVSTVHAWSPEASLKQDTPAP